MPTPDRTSLTEIIAAGRSILEESGPSGITMQAIAAHCGVRAPSLYKRIRDRDALLSAVAAAVVDDLATQLESTARLHCADETHGSTGEVIRTMQGHQEQGHQEQGYREQSQRELEALAHTYRAFAHEQPEGFRLMFTASPPLDALEQAARPVLAASAALVGTAEALHAARLFTAWATGFLQMELAGAFRLGGDVDGAFSYGLRHLLRGLGI